MTLKLPNFLIAGAAKCGTSSLYYHLRNHPQIYMSTLKEPHHFSTQNVDVNYRGVGDHRRPYVQDFGEFCKFFEGVQDEKAIGEASPDTMYLWDTSIPYIQGVLGDPKIIMILRNPVDRAFSAYLHLVRENREYLSFEEGLIKEKERIADYWQGLWHYVKAGMYFGQVKPFLQSFSRVKVFLNEDYNKSPSSVIRQACEFLEVDTDYQSPYIKVRYNTSGIPRSRKINYLFIMKNPVQRTIRKIGHAVFTEDKWIAMRDSVRARLMVKPTMKAETRAMLENVFKEDILKLQDLTKLNLSIWFKNK